MMHRPIGAHSHRLLAAVDVFELLCDLSKVANCNFSTSVLSILGLLVVTDHCVL